MRDRGEMRIGFIGFGNMAQAMAEGLITKGAVRADQIGACARNQEKLLRELRKRWTR